MLLRQDNQQVTVIVETLVRCAIQGTRYKFKEDSGTYNILKKKKMDPMLGHVLQSKREIISLWTPSPEKGNVMPGELIQVL